MEAEIISVVGPTPSIEDGALPAGWIEGFDETSSFQNNFYYNTVTGSCQWEVPMYPASVLPCAKSIQQVKAQAHLPATSQARDIATIPSERVPPPLQEGRTQSRSIAPPITRTPFSPKNITVLAEKQSTKQIDFKKKLQDLERQEKQSAKRNSGIFTSFRRSK